MRNGQQYKADKEIHLSTLVSFIIFYWSGRKRCLLRVLVAIKFHYQTEFSIPLKKQTVQYHHIYYNVCYLSF